jgi:hypothetical protein
MRLLLVLGFLVRRHLRKSVNVRLCVFSPCCLLLCCVLGVFVVFVVAMVQSHQFKNMPRD